MGKAVYGAVRHLTVDFEKQEPTPTETTFLPKALQAALRRYRWWIVLTAAVVTTLVSLWTLRLPKIYQAVVTLEYDPNPATPLGSSVEDVSGPISHFLMSREFFETQNLILQSRGIAERVVGHLGLADDPGFFGQQDNAGWTPVSTEAAAQTLQSKVSVEPVKDTRLVRLRVRDNDPDRAATLANAIADAYIDKTMEDRLGSTASAAEWLAEQLDSTRDQLNSSENALHEFKKQHNVLSVSLEDRQNLLAEEIRKYNERLTETKARRIELQAHLERLQSVRSDPQSAQNTVPNTDDELEDLRANIRNKLAERASLSVRYGNAHPKIQELDGELAALRKALMEEADGMIKSAEADLREAKAIEKGLAQALDQTQKAGLDLNLREIEYSRLSRQRESNSKLFDLLLQRTAETDLTRLLRTKHVRVVDRALVPKAAIAPIVALNLMGGAIAGVLLGLGLAFVLHQMDRRIQSVPDVELLGLTILGVFPRVGETIIEHSRFYSRKRRKTQSMIDLEQVEQIVHTHPMSAAAESCRTLRTNLTFMSAESPLRTLVITSADPRDGKTTVAANIAIAFAQSGQRVLLIDADLRRPRLHKAFEVDNRTGLTSALVGEKTLAEVTQSVDVEGLRVISSGPVPPNPAELLHTRQFAKLLQDAMASYDRVIFDSPPLRAVTDAAILAPQCSGVLLVVRSQNTTRDAVRAALRSLRDVKANIVGGVLNDVDMSRGGPGYGGYYQYYRSEDYRLQQEERPGHSQSAA